MKKNTLKIMIVLFFANLVTFNANGLDFRFLGSAVIEFKNETNQAITVIMNNVESHPIEAESLVTFSQAKIGDAPVFYVKNAKGAVLFARQVSMVGAKATFTWDGSKF